MLEDIKKRKKFVSSAGGWADIDSESLKKEVYISRAAAKRSEVSF